MAKRIHLPLTKEDIKDLHVGDAVLLTGTIYTARDAAHKKLKELMDQNKKLPFDLKNQIIYYVGPTPSEPNKAFGSAGPTTSSRMDAYTKDMLEHGMIGAIGKGKRSKETKELFQKHQAIYFVALGGAGAILGKCVKSCEMVAFEELLSEAIQKLEVVDFPVFVGYDIYGNDIYEGEKE